MYAVSTTARQLRCCSTYFVQESFLASGIGLCSAADRAQLDSLLRRSRVTIATTYAGLPAAIDLFNSADDDFFFRVRTNSDHVGLLQPDLPDIMRTSELRARAPNHSRPFLILVSHRGSLCQIKSRVTLTCAITISSAPVKPAFYHIRDLRRIRPLP